MPEATLARPGHALSRTYRELTRSASTQGAGRSVLLLTAVSIVLFVPQLTGWPLMHAHKEDGEVFLADALNLGPQAFLQTYSGYLHIAPRIIAALAVSLPLQFATVVIGVATAALRVLLGVLTIHALAPYAPTLRWARLAGVVVVLAPVGMQEALLNLTNMRWFLISGAVIALWGVFDRARWAMVAALVALAAALSDPLAVVLVPIALLRLGTLRTGWRVSPAAALLAGTVAQLAWLEPSARPPDVVGWVTEPLVHFQQLWVRGVAEAQYGQTGTEIFIRFGGAWLAVAAGGWVALLVLLAWRHGEDRGSVVFSAALMGTSVLLVAATLTFADLPAISLSEWWGVGQASRYGVIPSAVGGAGVVLLAAAAISARPPAAKAVGWISLLLLALALMGDLRGDPANSAGPTWPDSLAQAQAACDGQPATTTVTIPVTPVDVPHRWELRTTCSAILRP